MFKIIFKLFIYFAGGWKSLTSTKGDYLYYYTIPNLLENEKDPNMIELCRRYDPTQKLILFVSIIADVEECPETPTRSNTPVVSYRLI